MGLDGAMAVNGERPLSAAELTAAVPGLTDADEAMRLLVVVCALVDREAPDAPAEIAREAAIRTAGWLRQTSVTLGQLDQLRAHAVNAVRASGARALLAPWVVRRAAVGAVP